ncbi:MAG: AbrB/MazE/SpoVT family DNA-binding domain-containing protein [Oscillospiraceae bacterium]|jgi:hypothetical protein|nr:AbrB/MazE/SpoVT family DNA-binding domain-containing protein [Oscillospiraceae bacterium]
MQQSSLINNTKPEHKRISISVKRQLTIPQKYFSALGFSNEAECIMQKDGLLIRPVCVTNGSEFSEQILSDLISQGFEGQQLLEQFKKYSRAVRPAVLKMLDDNETFAKSGDGNIPMDELFIAEAN